MSGLSSEPSDSLVRDCPYCEGTGTFVGRADGGGATDGVFEYERPCGECDGTGKRHRTTFQNDRGQVIIVSGSAPLSEQTKRAFLALAEAVGERMHVVDNDQEAPGV